jgi:5-methylthioadenosine/S-adenosylhomocysteine deaminase
MALALRSNRVVLHERGKFVIVPARVVVSGASIERVELDPAPAVPADGLQELDLGERLITPAFVNAHAHLALSFMRGRSLPLGAELGSRADPRASTVKSARQNLVEELFFEHERRLTPPAIRAFTRMGAYESLLAGVGFVWDHYYGGRATADALLDTGLAGAIAPTLQDLAGPGMHDTEAQLEATLSIAQDARCYERGVLAALGPHAPDTVSPALLRKVAELARKEQLPVHMHVAQSYDELHRLETRVGRSPLALLSREGVLDEAPHVLLGHALFAHVGDLRSLNPNRHTLLYCPSAQLQFGFPAPLPLWSELGLRWTVGTDTGASNDTMSVQPELRLAAGAASAMTTGSLALARFTERGQVHDAEDAWAQRKERVARFARHVTSSALLSRVWHEAGSMHPALQVGSIARGALANLAVWELDHPAFWPGTDLLRALAYGDTSQALHTLVVAGRVIGTPGDLVRSVLGSDAYRAAREEANARLSELFGSH